MLALSEIKDFYFQTSTHFERSIPTVKVLVIDRVTEQMSNFLMFYLTTNGYQCLLEIIDHKIALFKNET